MGTADTLGPDYLDCYLYQSSFRMITSRGSRTLRTPVTYLSHITESYWQPGSFATLQEILSLFKEESLSYL